MDWHREAASIAAASANSSEFCSSKVGGALLSSLRLRAVYNVLPEHVQLVYEARVLAGDLEPLAASTLESSETLSPVGPAVRPSAAGE